MTSNTIKTRAILSLLSVALMLCSFAFPAANQWSITEGTKANFTIDGMMGIDVDGTLKFSNATITFDPANPQSASMNVTLSVATIATGIGKRDKHLKTADFFDAPKFPSINFKSTSVEKTSSGYKVTGTLKIKSVSKSVSIPFTFSAKGNTATFKGNFTIDRTQFGVGTGKENGVGDEVRIKLEIPVTSIG